MGGCHAQREIFTDILLDACLQAGEYELVSELIEGKRRHRPDRPLALFALEKALKSQGQNAQAAEAGGRARRLWHEMGADPDILGRFTSTIF